MFEAWLLTVDATAHRVLRAAPNVVGNRFIALLMLVHHLAVLWPFMLRFLEEVLSRSARADGSANQLISNVETYAAQPWRFTAIRAVALMYQDCINPAYFETIAGDSQLQVGEMARRVCEETTR